MHQHNIDCDHFFFCYISDINILCLDPSCPLVHKISVKMLPSAYWVIALSLLLPHSLLIPSLSTWCTSNATKKHQTFLHKQSGRAQHYFALHTHKYQSIHSCRVHKYCTYKNVSTVFVLHYSISVHMHRDQKEGSVKSEQNHIQSRQNAYRMARSSAHVTSKQCV